MKSRLFAVMALAALAPAASALAQPSRGAAEATIGTADVVIDYGQPKLGDRSLDELMKKLPADRIWRAGENQVTTLVAGGDLMVGGTKVPAGTYSVYVHVGDPGAWSFVLNEDLGVPLGQIWAEAPDNMKDEMWPHLGDYTETIKKLEVVRAEMKPVKGASRTDPFTMSFEPSGEGADLTLAWGDQAWQVEIKPAK
jgi:hypothetical protein